MPMFDFECNECHAEFEALDRPSVPATCKSCGSPHLTKVFRATPSSVIGDEIDIVQENGFPVPRRFRSREERARALRELGLMERNMHVPGDKHTKPWGGISQESLDGARAMLERIATGKTTPEDHADLIEAGVDGGVVTVDSGVQVGNRRIGLRIREKIDKYPTLDELRSLYEE